MVYNWDGKEAECYQLYVYEKRSLNEVVEYWEQRGFTPRYVTAELEEGGAVLTVRPLSLSFIPLLHADIW